MPHANSASLPPADRAVIELAERIGLQENQLSRFAELSPYLILDGHRTGFKGHADDPVGGYVEGAIFSIRLSQILQSMGSRQATFLVHTLRNYATPARMAWMFEAAHRVGDDLIRQSCEGDVRLRFFGQDVRTSYELAPFVQRAESATAECGSFTVNYLANYSDDWAAEHRNAIRELPEVNVICRFTKGHYSGAGIPGHAQEANFVYVQNASVAMNWSAEELQVLAVALLRAHVSLSGFVGRKSYDDGERETIGVERDVLLHEEHVRLSSEPRKRVISFTSTGPLKIEF